MPRMSPFPRNRLLINVNYTAFLAQLFPSISFNFIPLHRLGRSCFMKLFLQSPEFLMFQNPVLTTTGRGACVCRLTKQIISTFFFLFITPRKLKLYEMHKVPNSRLPRAFSELSAYRTTCVCESSSNYTALQLWIVTQTHIGTFNMLRFRIYWRISIESNGVFVCSQTDR